MEERLTSKNVIDSTSRGLLTADAVFPLMSKKKNSNYQRTADFVYSKKLSVKNSRITAKFNPLTSII